MNVIRVVTGPPCSGKSTFVRDNAGPDDVVIDFDLIAEALGYPGEHVDWSEPVQHPARVAAMIARASLVKAACAGRIDGTVWIVDASVPSVSRYLSPPAVVVSCDPGRDECRRRAEADGRPAGTLEQIDRWYADLVGVTSTEW